MDLTDKIKQALNIPDGVDVDDWKLMFPPVDGVSAGADDIFVIPGKDASTVRLAYASYDTDPHDYWEEDDGKGVFERFGDADAFRDFVKRTEARGKAVLLVDVYEHSLVHYSVSGSRDYPNVWAKTVEAAFVPCDELQTAWKSGVMTRADVIADTNNILDEYSRWCNGETCMLVYEDIRFDKDTATLDRVDYEVSAGIIGSDVALDTLRSEIGISAESSTETKKAAKPQPRCH